MRKSMVPTRLFFTRGVGQHKERAASFELAMRDAGLAAQNIVRVSSILPPTCKLVPRKEGLSFLQPGEITFAVLAENATSESHRLLVSSVGVAIPADKSIHGFISSHHAFGETEEQAGEQAQKRAAELLAATLDVPFDTDASLDEQQAVYRVGGHAVRTANVTQAAEGSGEDEWTTTIAAAVLLFDDPQ